VLVTTGTVVFEKQFERDHPVALLRKPFDHAQLVMAVEMLLYNKTRMNPPGRA
jgi:mRNA-degrading endonuclease YafQ of YafQ-DinJ toxin-antitoxin module